MMKFVTGLALSVVLVSGVAFAQTVGEQRVGKMKDQGGAMGALTKMAKGEDPYDAAKAAAAATALHNSSMQLVTWFPAGSKSGRAKDEIWSDNAKFQDVAKAFMAETEAFAKVAGTGKDAMAAALGKLGGACGNCHTPFRAPAP
jgi:cytochrome c556